MATNKKSMASNKKARPNRLALGASIAAALLSGYGSRQAFAGSCTGSAGTYTCSGAADSATDTTQTLNSGANPLTVTTTAGFGIDVSSGDAFSLTTGSTGLSFTDNNASSIIGGNDGIYAVNIGTGATTITTTGLVEGANGRGIEAYNALAAGNLTINAADVSGGADGINAVNIGTGATTITATGMVTGEVEGITVYNASAAGNLTINAADVSGGANGINADNQGSGITTITATGTVTGTGINSSGIYARNSGTDLTINAVDVSGIDDGVRARNFGTGTATITATGTVTGTLFEGIYAFNSSSATALTISAASVSGGVAGIRARNFGTGATSITTTGTVTGNSGGIYAYNVSSASDLTISAASVSGGVVGIRAGNSGTGFTSITVSGAVTGGTGAGIDNNSNNATTITLNAGASVSATTGNAIVDSAGDTTVTVNTGASITGSVNLGGGNNQLILNGGALNVQTGSALTVTGDVTNSAGTINLQNSTIDAPATINGDFTGGGQLLIDADFANDTADTLTITGNVLAGGTQVGVNDISSGPATGNDITLISVGGTTAAGDFALASNVVNGAYDYNTLSLVGNDWVLQSVGGITPSVPVFTPFASTFEVLGQSLLTLEALPSYSARIHNRMTGASSGDNTGIDAPVWMRVTGGKRKIDSRSSTTGTDFDTNQWQAQIGADFTLSDTASHQFVLGINAGYGQANTDVNAITGKGGIDTDSYSIGISGTWQLANSTYIDLQTQKSWYETDLSANGTGAGSVNGIDGDGYSASIEAGRSYALSDTLTVTPQAQLVYAKVDTDNFTGANGEIVRLTDSKSLKARMGAELNKQFTEDGATHGFILANVIHEFKDKTQVNVSGAQLANSVDKWSGELGAGITHAWDTGTTHYELFAAVTAGTSLNHVGDSHSVQGEVGFKVNF